MIKRIIFLLSILIAACFNNYAMHVQRDSLLKTVGIIGAGTSAFCGAKALELLLQDQCIGQCGAYVTWSAGAAIASALSVYRFFNPGSQHMQLPMHLPITNPINQNQLLAALRSGSRAVVCAALATRRS